MGKAFNAAPAKVLFRFFFLENNNKDYCSFYNICSDRDKKKGEKKYKTRK